ncbi:hypothetical protein B0T21DRAFT_167422 [Apiosordaria backusii]|uniref:Secreted protein n=1 Tax=Apiosordaria backusii TaxID=314023 RepID=A0AA40BNL2_9PEZI|nr:hypothetical protein B0T21DRAFT_167422 [Apiosordaria backusii]
MHWSDMGRFAGSSMCLLSVVLHVSLSCEHDGREFSSPAIICTLQALCVCNMKCCAVHNTPLLSSQTYRFLQALSVSKTAISILNKGLPTPRRGLHTVYSVEQRPG